VPLPPMPQPPRAHQRSCHPTPWPPRPNGTRPARRINYRRPFGRASDHESPRVRVTRGYRSAEPSSTAGYTGDRTGGVEHRVADKHRPRMTFNSPHEPTLRGVRERPPIARSLIRPPALASTASSEMLSEVGRVRAVGRHEFLRRRRVSCPRIAHERADTRPHVMTPHGRAPFAEWRVASSPMGAAEIRTVGDVERLTPDQRQELVNERTSTDLSDVPDDFVERARADGRRLLVERGVIDEG